MVFGRVRDEGRVIFTTIFPNLCVVYGHLYHQTQASLSVRMRFFSLHSRRHVYTTSIIMFIDLIIANALLRKKSDDESSVSTIVLESVPDFSHVFSIEDSDHVTFFTSFCHLLAVAVL